MILNHLLVTMKTEPLKNIHSIRFMIIHKTYLRCAIHCCKIAIENEINYSDMLSRKRNLRIPVSFYLLYMHSILFDTANDIRDIRLNRIEL